MSREGKHYDISLIMCLKLGISPTFHALVMSTHNVYIMQRKAQLTVWLKLGISSSFHAHVGNKTHILKKNKNMIFTEIHDMFPIAMFCNTNHSSQVVSMKKSSC